MKGLGVTGAVCVHTSEYTCVAMHLGVLLSAFENSRIFFQPDRYPGGDGQEIDCREAGREIYKEENGVPFFKSPLLLSQRYGSLEAPSAHFRCLDVLSGAVSQGKRLHRRPLT